MARAAEFLLNGARVTRAIYVGADDALDVAVGLWAESLVGPDPSDEGIWARALSVARNGTPTQIDAFLRAERARLRLKALENLPRPELRSAEMFGDRVAILVHDKANLDEEDIFAATFLVYGKSDQPLVKRIGPRWFVAPGRVGEVGGCVVLDDSGVDVVASFHDSTGRLTLTETLVAVRVAKLSVQG
jgi:hypothetical protein